jgi:hypothetical protein
MESFVQEVIDEPKGADVGNCVTVAARTKEKEKDERKDKG